jgi:outer membrane immunogenic protein
MPEQATALSPLFTLGGLGMRRLAVIGVGLISVAGFAGAASAADLPAKVYTKAPMVAPIYNWTGFYIGFDTGGGFSRNCWNVTSAVGAPSEGCHNATGGMVGGQVGYRWQMSNYVFGVEAQGDWANLKGSNTSATGTFGGLPFSNQTRIDAIGLFTGQVGYAWNNILGYVKGGGAVTHDKYNGVSQFAFGAFPAGVAFDQASETRWGGAVGAGIEVGLVGGWSVGVEYDHLFMGKRSLNLVTPAGVFDRTDSIRQDVDMATVRLNYRFGGPIVARY